MDTVWYRDGGLVHDISDSAPSRSLSSSRGVSVGGEGQLAVELEMWILSSVASTPRHSPAAGISLVPRGLSLPSVIKCPEIGRETPVADNRINATVLSFSLPVTQRASPGEPASFSLATSYRDVDGGSGLV